MFIQNMVYAKSYETLTFEIPQEKENIIEVIEFFSYICPHCNNMELYLQEWEKNIQDNIILKRIPIANNHHSQILQRIYFTIEELGKTNLNIEIFIELSKNKNYFKKNKEIKNWLIRNRIPIEEFNKIYNSFSIETKIKKYNNLVKLCNLTTIPVFIVGGKYLTSPILAGNKYNATIQEINKLIAKYCIEKNIPSINSNIN
ncbi:thiol:disulfide interchange protein DsbA/DsbL [Candidatus Kinetoplastidibacterium desouzai]|nr:thiol:disulfide interchange protein DsbA/DsbL [Candidatus Kinetoplastibacterium desouzaii]